MLRKLIVQLEIVASRQRIRIIGVVWEASSEFALITFIAVFSDAVKVLISVRSCNDLI